MSIRNGGHKALVHKLIKYLKCLLHHSMNYRILPINRT